MSKLSFRPRALETTKPLPIYMHEELPDLPEYSAINRAVPQLPSGMDKEEECEHHLQRAIVTGLIIPTPEVVCMEDKEAYDRLYPANYKPPRQLIHMQPFSMEEDVPDYDIDSEDERWLSKQKLDITPLKFEEMMDRLEKNCAQNFASQNHKELLSRNDDEVSIAVFDYWLNKRLARKPLPLVPCVRTEANNRSLGGSGNVNSNNNPYLAFRRRIEKMQTRKNRKNDEMSYEKMIKLRRDLVRALQILDMVKRRENMKRDLVKVSIQMYEKRYEANDFSGALLQEVSSYKTVRPAFAPLYPNQFSISAQNHHWPLKPPKEDLSSGRKEKRPYKKRKHKSGLGASSSLAGAAATPGSSGSGHLLGSGGGGGGGGGGLGGGTTTLGPGCGGGGASSAEEDLEAPPSPHHAFPFQRTPLTTYHAPRAGGGIGGAEWMSPEEGGAGDERYRYSLATLTHPKPLCVGLVRRRIGRGGRVVLDRAGPSMDDFWSSMDFTILDNAKPPIPCSRWFRPKSPPPGQEELSPPPAEEDPLTSGSICLAVESLGDAESTTVDLELSDLFPELDLPPPASSAPAASSHHHSSHHLPPSQQLQPPPPAPSLSAPLRNAPFSSSSSSSVSLLGPPIFTSTDFLSTGSSTAGTGGGGGGGGWNSSNNSSSNSSSSSSHFPTPSGGGAVAAAAGYNSSTKWGTNNSNNSSQPTSPSSSHPTSNKEGCCPSVTTVTPSSPAPNTPSLHLNSKLAQRAAVATNSQLNSGGEEVTHKRGSSLVVDSVVHTHPMEVT